MQSDEGKPLSESLLSLPRQEFDFGALQLPVRLLLRPLGSLKLLPFLYDLNP